MSFGVIARAGETSGAPQELQEAVLHLSQAIHTAEVEQDAAEELVVTEAEHLVAVHCELQHHEIQAAEAYKAALLAQQVGPILQHAPVHTHLRACKCTDTDA